MIATVILAILFRSIFSAAQNQVATNFSIADDQTNWADLWKAITARKSADSRSGVGDSTRPALFDIILRVNAQARSKSKQRSGETEFLFQGDIAMDKRDVVAMFRNGGRRKRAVMKKLATKLWQRNKIAYVISSNLGEFAKQRILAAIKQWQNTLPCMGKWKDISKLKSTERPRDYIRFIKGEGCYSRVGRQGGRQVISIGTGCEHTGVVVHEIGHAMGFWHEQSRTDRDDYVEIHWNNILPAMRFNFEKYSSSKINDLGVGYDYESVMHYGSKAFSKDGRALTISIKRGKTKNVRVRLGQKYQLSDKDKKQAQLLYNCITKLLPCSSSPCLNGGACRNNGDEYSCRCTPRYTGVKCEKKINQVCVDKDRRCGGWGKAGYCSPEKGYEDFMKKKCCATCRFPTTVKPSPCSSSPCLNSGACVNNGDKYSCSCTSGYTGTRCETKVRPCSSSPCLNGGVCTNNGHRYRCSCTSGYGGSRCEVKGSSTKCAENKQTKYNCERWKSYCVYRSTYYEYMKKNCCKTCEENCKDKHVFCVTWSKNNFCRLEDFKPFMQKNCVVSCGFPC